MRNVQRGLALIILCVAACGQPSDVPDLPASEARVVVAPAATESVHELRAACLLPELPD